MQSNTRPNGVGGAAARLGGEADVPSSPDAEEMLLGGCFVEPEEGVYLVGDKLRPEHFFLSWNATIYKAMLSLGSSTPRRPTTLTFVTEKLRNTGQLAAAGGMSYLTMLAEKTVSAVNMEILAEIIHDKYLRRSLIEAGGAIATMGHDNETDINVLVERAEQRIYIIQDRSVTKGLRHISDVVTTTFTAIESRGMLNKLLGGSSLGVKTGFYDLDALIKALKRKTLTVVGGRPGMGKTGWADSLVLNVSTSQPQGKPPPAIAFFSLEMSVEEQAIRMLSNLSAIDGGYIEEGRLTDPQWVTIGEAISALSQRNIWLSDDADLTISGVRAQSRRLKAAHPDLALIIVDYLQLIKGDHGEKLENRYLHISHVARELKRMSTELDVPVVSLSQLNREVDTRPDKRPQLRDLRESGEIEQAADLILFLYRNGYYYPDCAHPYECEVIVAKQRNGPTGTAKLLFIPELTRFVNMAGSGTMQVYNHG